MKAEVYTNESLRKLSNLSDNSIDLCLTDLPYGETAQDWDSIIPIEPMWKELKRVCKKDAAILLFASGGIYQAELILSQRRAFKFKYYWKKNRAGMQIAEACELSAQLALTEKNAHEEYRKARPQFFGIFSQIFATSTNSTKVVQPNFFE